MVDRRCVRLSRRALLWGAALGLIVGGRPLPVRGHSAITLDAARLSHLRGLAPLSNAMPAPAAYAGRVVVVNFFASWCPPCHPEFQALVALERTHRAQGLSVIAINVFEDWEGAARDSARLGRFLDRYRPDFPVVQGDDATKAMFGDVRRIPTLFVFARDRRALHHFIHEENSAKTHLSPSELGSLVIAALSEPTPAS